MEAVRGLHNKAALKEQGNSSEIADCMGKLSGTSLPESEDYHRFIRTISMPREEEYVQLIAKQIELLNRKEELLEELEEVTDSKEVHKEKTDIGMQGKVVQKTVPAVQEAKLPSKDEIRKKEIEAELKRLDEEMESLKKNLEGMFPESRRMQCMIYPTFREGELICAGVIKGKGWGFNGEEELCDKVKPETKRERAMLILGNSILDRELEQVLNIEIYPEAVCVVYPNGLTKVYR